MPFVSRHLLFVNDCKLTAKKYVLVDPARRKVKRRVRLKLQVADLMLLAQFLT